VLVVGFIFNFGFFNFCFYRKIVKNVMPDGAWDNGDPFVFNIGDL
jgi:hypothetical protein